MESTLEFKHTQPLKLLLWKLAWDILPSAQKISSICPPTTPQAISNSCQICKEVKIENISHLFLKCRLAKFIWLHSPWPINSALMASQSFMDWIRVILNPTFWLGIPASDSHYFQLFASVACDLIWTCRNKLIKEAVAINPDLILKQISRSV